MRRSEKAIRNREVVEELLRSAPVCRIGLAKNSAAGYPYVVPVHFVYAAGSIYLHSAHHGRKIEMIKGNPRVCVEIDELLGLKRADRACDFGSRFRSLIAFGRARIVEDGAAKSRALSLLMEKYAGEMYSGKSFDFSQQELEGVAIIEIRIEELTGKEG
jgi:nitroimidazol reductase NimA-like FMN-containing flavoprotein (pyridoxamine 5'-phosphate oxidase superfamily)